MQMIRSVVWVLLLAALMLFSMNNWTDLQVRIWEGLIWQTKLPAVVVISFLLGLVPMWLRHLAGRWRMNRRIASLEAAARQPSAALTSTQLDAAAPAPATTPADPSTKAL